MMSSSNSTEIVSISIPQSCVIGDVVYYDVTTSTPIRATTSRKRFNQFVELHKSIVLQVPETSLPAGAMLPPKRPKALISHTDPGFIEDRRVLLQHYLRKLLSVDTIASSSIFLSFFATDQQSTVTPVQPDPINQWNPPADAEVTFISVPSSRPNDDHILYQIECVNERRRKSFSQWTVFKRFNQAYEMDTAIRESHQNQPYLVSQFPRLPSKAMKGLINHHSPHFIEHRRVLLDAYLKKALQIPEMARHKEFIQFCGVNQSS